MSTDDPGQRVSRLAQKRREKRLVAAQEKEQTKLQFREQMPEIAVVVDLVREVFGDDCKVLYAEENGKRLAAVKRLRFLGLNEQGR